MLTRILACVLVASAVGLAASGCGQSTGQSGSQPGAGQSSSGGAARVTGQLTVFAAASLTESFTKLGKDFEAANPGTTVRFNFAGSSALAQQINQGAPADVFAAASPATLQQVVDAGGVSGQATVFARNELQIVVPTGNPAKISSLADFGKAELTIALCAEQVPCGAAAGKAMAAAGVTAQPDTLEQDVRAVLTKVRLGEVDAALVYRTDVLSGGDQVQGIDFPEAAQAINDYPIATLAEAPNASAAAAFVAFVLSPAGRTVLQEAGFASA